MCVCGRRRGEAGGFSLFYFFRLKKKNRANLRWQIQHKFTLSDSITMATCWWLVVATAWSVFMVCLSVSLSLSLSPKCNCVIVSSFPCLVSRQPFQKKKKRSVDVVSNHGMGKKQKAQPTKKKTCSSFFFTYNKNNVKRINLGNWKK